MLLKLSLIAAILLIFLPTDANANYCSSCCMCNDLGKLKAQVSSLAGKESKTEHLLNKQKDHIETLLKDMKVIKEMIERLTRVQNLATTSTKTPRTTKPETTNSPTTYPPTTYPPTSYPPPTYPPTTRPEITSSPATPSSTFAEATCPDSSWFRKSDSCYKFINSYEKTWLDAKADCETRGSRSIEHEDEECWNSQCGKGGLCDWCRQGACCKKGLNDGNGCDGSNGCTAFHCCSLPVPVRGAHLVTIETKEENNFLLQTLREENLGGWFDGFGWWIGLNDRESEGNWEWVQPKRVLEYSNWVGNGPTGGEHCAYFIYGWGKGGKWNPENCSSGGYFICEKNLST